jgi:hypothetical protein
MERHLKQIFSERPVLFCYHYSHTSILCRPALLYVNKCVFTIQYAQNNLSVSFTTTVYKFECVQGIFY